MIKLNNISAGYGKRNIISNVDVDFPKGKITAIIGPNGSGKSTLLKSICGLCSVNDGNIILANKDINQYSNSDRAKIISYLPQQRPVPAITVERMVLHGRFPYLGYPRRYKKEDYDICDRAIKEAGISEIRQRTMDELSGGERQKVYLAMSYAGESEVLLLDEPMTFLDIRYQLDLIYMMKKLKSEGKTVIVILHDLNAAMQNSDYILVMKKGNVIDFDIPEEIYSKKILEDVFEVKQKLILGESGEKYYVFT